MARDYMPQADAAFNQWFSHFLDAFGGLYEALGFGAAEYEELAALRGDWAFSLDENVAWRAEAHGARLQKDAARASSEALIRVLAAQIQANPAVTDAQRLALGLPVRRAQRVRRGVPQVAPEVLADASQRGLVRLRFGERPTDGARNRLAAGAVAVLLEFRARSDEPWRWMACAPGTTFVHVIGGEAAVEFEYRARYVGRGGVAGPGSEAVVAFVAPAA